MKKALKYLLPALVLIGIFGGMAIKLKKNKTTAESRVYHADPSVTPPNPAEPAAASGLSTPGELLFTGTFEPNREAKISAEVQGKITKIFVDAGSTVAKGQKLVQLDNSLLQLQLQSADVQIEGLTADVNRYSILAKADAVQGVQLEKAQLGLKSAKVQRATILEQIAKTTIKSPFVGVVFAKLSEEGSFAAPGVPLIHLLDVEQLRFTINVPEGDLQHFQLGKKLQIVADAIPGKLLTGRVTLIASKANVGSSFPVQLTVQNLPGHALRAGMFGKITLPNQH